MVMAFFALPNQAKTTFTRPSKLVYNDDEDGESGGESDGDGDDDSDDDDVEEVQGQRGGRRALEGPSAGTSGAAATSLGPWIPLLNSKFVAFYMPFSPNLSLYNNVIFRVFLVFLSIL